MFWVIVALALLLSIMLIAMVLLQPLYGALVSRVSQVIAGEIPLDDVWARIDEDVKQKVADASKK